MKKKDILIIVGIFLIAIGIGFFDFNNDASKKIEVIFVGDETISIEDFEMKSEKKNELIYEFTLTNSLNEFLDFEMYFDSHYRGPFEYIDMKVIKEENVNYNKALSKLSDDYVFEKAMLEPFGKIRYKVIFKSKIVNFNFYSAVRLKHKYVDN